MAKIMKFTAAGAFLLTLMCGIIHFSHPSGICLSFTITFGTITYHLVMRLLTGYLFDKFMNNRADYTKKWFQLKPWEHRLYERLKVKKWKNGMPTYSPKLFSPKEHTWDEIAQAMCQAELVHETISFLSFVPLIFSFWLGSFGVFLTTSIFSACIDLSFAMIQRYNRPRVLKLRKKQLPHP